MSSSAHILHNPRLPGTLALSASALILGIPVATAALLLEKVYMPDIVLGSKTINIGPNNDQKTITFDLISGPNDAVIVAAYISVISSLLVMVGLVLVRHMSHTNAFGWTVVGPSLVSVLGNIGCCAAAFILSGKNGKASSADEVKFENGKYDTNGKLYTWEAWACMMNDFYREREPWAEKACSSMKTGRILTIPLIIMATMLLAIGLWQAQRRYGSGWLLGRRKNITATSSRAKSEYFDLQIRN